MDLNKVRSFCRIFRVAIGSGLIGYGLGVLGFIELQPAVLYMLRCPLHAISDLEW